MHSFSLVKSSLNQYKAADSSLSYFVLIIHAAMDCHGIFISASFDKRLSHVSGLLFWPYFAQFATHKVINKRQGMQTVYFRIFYFSDIFTCTVGKINKYINKKPPSYILCQVYITLEILTFNIKSERTCHMISTRIPSFAINRGLSDFKLASNTCIACNSNILLGIISSIRANPDCRRSGLT